MIHPLLLKAHLHCVVPGICSEIRQRFEKFRQTADKVSVGNRAGLAGAFRFVGRLDCKTDEGALNNCCGPGTKYCAKGIVYQLISGNCRHATIRVTVRCSVWIGRVFLRRNLRQQGRRDEVPIARTRVASPWKMITSVCRIVDSDGDFPRGISDLNTEIPLKDVRVTSLFRAKIVACYQSPTSASFPRG